ncbi:hypothetical protein CM15mP43_10320 [bacterium]|nr:MAG: hypothetical protein CM15mP43_10320 [bacterium]
MSQTRKSLVGGGDRSEKSELIIFHKGELVITE